MIRWVNVEVCKHSFEALYVSHQEGAIQFFTSFIIDSQMKSVLSPFFLNRHNVKQRVAVNQTIIDNPAIAEVSTDCDLVLVLELCADLFASLK